MSKIDWKAYVKEHPEFSSFLSEKFIEDAKKWQGKRLSFEKKIQEIAADEKEVGFLFQNLIYNICKHLADNGQPEIFTKDVGFNADALKDGEYILEISEPGHLPSRS